MKKILLASSALVLVGGAAFAEVTLEGYAAMGVIGGDDYIKAGDDYDDNEYSFVSDLDVTFVLSGETDGGVTFGAAIELDDAIGSPQFANEEDQGGESVFVSGDFGTITMGDTNGAFDYAIAEYIRPHKGTIGDVEEYGAYSGGYGIDPLDDGLDGIFGGQVARYDYSFGGFGIAVSAELDDDFESDPLLGIGATYNFAFAGGSVLVGAAYQGVHDATVGANIDDDSDEFTGFSFDSTAENVFDGDLDVYGISAQLVLDMGLQFNAVVSQTEIDGT
ncbi:porin [Mangrovicoccus ximenensis]|uniref:porin n=1 Tax=Mangrovicoccus ximenensis TaxID=1911570 RepID=UPI000D3A84C9|nr:porin [Mangrovicoccus ximenensis]